jgi:hypothetical protein
MSICTSLSSIRKGKRSPNFNIPQISQWKKVNLLLSLRNIYSLLHFCVLKYSYQSYALLMCSYILGSVIMLRPLFYCGMWWWNCIHMLQNLVQGKQCFYISNKVGRICPVKELCCTSVLFIISTHVCRKTSLLCSLRALGSARVSSKSMGVGRAPVTVPLASRAL